MLRVEDSKTWRSAAQEAASKLSVDAQLALRLPHGGERFAAQVLEHCAEAVHVAVPTTPDQVERIVLGLGAALGSDAQFRLDEQLRDPSNELQPALDYLRDRLEQRPLVVDGWDAIGQLGADLELRLALDPRWRTLKNWLTHQPGLFLSRHRERPDIGHADPPQGCPIYLRNGVERPTDLWDRFAQDASLYSLGLTALALGAEEDEVLERGGAAALTSMVVALLPPNVRCVLERLSAHGRPLERRFLPVEIPDGAIEVGADLGLWVRTPTGLVVAEPWRDWMSSAQPEDVRRSVHLELAEAFLADYDLDDPTAGRCALSILEAHRHLVAAGDLVRAGQHARYGLALLTQYARERSLAQDFANAAQQYEQVLTIARTRCVPMPRRLSAYVRHYLHFNRARARLEGLRATEAGYHQSLEDWRDNALFWSRYVRSLFYQGRSGAAFRALEEAKEEVPEHPQKRTVLIARTANGLLVHGRVLEALQVWGGYQSDTPYAQEIEGRLQRSLDVGFDTMRIELVDDASLILHRSRRVQIVRQRNRTWRAEVRDLELSGRGQSPLEALEALVVAARGEISHLIRAYTSDLSPQERFRKRLLLGAVDVPASRLGGAAPPSYWFVGSVCRGPDGGLWMRTEGERDLWFEIPADKAQGLVVDALPRLFAVKTDESGVPVGPVTDIDEPFRGTDEDLWDRWRRRMADGD